MRGDSTIRRSLWRWRRNPLRRREDVLEAWILLIVWFVIAVAAPAAGVLASHAAAHSAAERRVERHSATATLVSDASSNPLATGTTGGRVDATVRWTASDGTRHSGKIPVDEGMKAGSRVTVWTDSRNQPTAAPPSAAQAGVDAAFMGAASSFAVVAVASAGYYGARVVLNRRRRAAWAHEWEDVSSQWGRTAN
ncbi:Rv1733c family protein [Streptomyces olivaceus]|uniref:Rv1733c family protein n=1 Tax=Streptomyces olivaceus TaxID=47716 RepID=UPI0033B77BC8